MSQFASPAPPGEGIQWADLNGALLLISVTHLEQGIKTAFGDSDAIRAKVAVLDGPQANTVHENTLIFPKVLRSQLAGAVGQTVLGRLTQGTAKPGQSPPWMLAAATPADEQTATTWLANRNAQAAPQPQPQPEAPQPTTVGGGAQVPF